MDTLYFDLLFFDSGMAMRPVAIIRVKSSGGQEYGGEKYDQLISPECVSVQELDANIDLLQRELEKIRAEGRRRLAKAA